MAKKVVLVLLVLPLLALYPVYHLFHSLPPDPGVLGAKNPDYTYVFVGDSMTEYLGNFDELRGYLKKYYPTKTFLLLNYGFSSTNILSVEDRIDKDSSHSGRIFEAINNIPYDAIFIESMGDNPLSQYPINVGLEKQNQALDKVVSTLKSKHPSSPIIFIATISPNRYKFGEGTVDLSEQQRHNWADERSAYIENHIKYAKDHNIPLVDIYDSSLEDGTGNLDYIRGKDLIHPSPNGVYFISSKIADFIHQSGMIK